MMHIFFIAQMCSNEFQKNALPTMFQFARVGTDHQPHVFFLLKAFVNRQVLRKTRTVLTGLSYLLKNQVIFVIHSGSQELSAFQCNNAAIFSKKLHDTKPDHMYNSATMLMKSNHHSCLLTSSSSSHNHRISKQTK